MDKIGDLYIYLLLIFSVVFTVLLIGVVKKNYFVGIKSKHSDVEYADYQSQNTMLKKISTRPFLFKLEKKLISEEELYFDEENFYAIKNKHQIATFKLTDITEVSKTFSEINNRKLWQIKIKRDNGKEIVFRFAHNYSIWNKNFLHFYKKIKLIKPNAIKTKWSIWNL